MNKIFSSALVLTTASLMFAAPQTSAPKDTDATAQTSQKGKKKHKKSSSDKQNQEKDKKATQ